MPLSRAAVEAFLAERGPNPLRVKGKSHDRLCDIAEQLTGLRPKFKNKPRACQTEGFVFALWAQRCLLFYEPRTGKTAISLYYIEHLKRIGELTKALIIAHAPIGVDEWEGQYRDYCGLDIQFIRSESAAWEELCHALDSDCDAVVIAWSTLQLIFTVNLKTGKKKNKLHADMDKLEAVSEFFNVLIIDEIHKASNIDSLYCTMAVELAYHCDWRIGLTGTPFGRDPSKLWAQAYIIDDGEALSDNWAFFQQAFGKKEHNYFSKTDDFPFDNSKIEIVRDKIRHMMLSCELTEVQDVNVLPGVVRLPMSDRQRDAYEEVVEQAIKRKMRDEKEANNIFVKTRQIASGYTKFVDDDGKTRFVDFIGASKLVWVEDFFSHFDPDMKFIIVHEFTHSGELLCRILSKLGLKHQWLNSKTRDRPALKQNFQEGDTQGLVLQWQTGGTSINLSAADYLLFFESPLGTGRKQVESRPLARGSRPLIVDDLICAPVEKKILSYVAEGKSLLADIKNDPTCLR